MSNFFNSGYWSNFHSLSPWIVFLIVLFALIIYLFPSIVTVIYKKRQAGGHIRAKLLCRVDWRWLVSGFNLGGNQRENRRLKKLDGGFGRAAWGGGSGQGWRFLPHIVMYYYNLSYMIWSI